MKKTTLFSLALAMTSSLLAFNPGSEVPHDEFTKRFAIDIDNNTPFKLLAESYVYNNRSSTPVIISPFDDGRSSVSAMLTRFPNIQVNDGESTVAVITFKRPGGQLPNFKANDKIIISNKDGGFAATLNGEQLEVVPLSKWLDSVDGRVLSF